MEQNKNNVAIENKQEVDPIQYNEQDKEQIVSNLLGNLFSNLDIDDDSENIEIQAEKSDSKLNENYDCSNALSSNSSTEPSVAHQSIFKGSIMNLSQKNLVMLIKKVNGSVKIQDDLNTMCPKEINWIFENILPSLVEIMCSLYGNYFFQKFISFLNVEQRIILINKISQDFKQICINKHGTYCIQSLYKQSVSSEEINQLNNLISSNLSSLISNENGIHIIIDLLSLLPEEKREFINDFLITNIASISSFKLGNICIKKFIGLSKKMKDRIISTIKSNFYVMIKNDLSINIIFFVWKTFGYDSCKFIIEEITKKFFYFIKFQNHKIDFVERCLLMMGKYENSNFNCFSFSLFQNDYVFYSICASTKGKKILKTMYNNSSKQIQEFFLCKYIQLKI